MVSLTAASGPCSGGPEMCLVIEATALRAWCFPLARIMNSRFEPTILQSLRRITRALDVYSRQLASQSQLTVPQLLTLRHIVAHASCTPSEIARAVALSQATITGILDRLEGRNLVQRERSKRDKRRVHITLTELGEQVVKAAPSTMSSRFTDRLAAMPEGEQAMFDWILARLADMMEGEQVSS